VAADPNVTLQATASLARVTSGLTIAQDDFATARLEADETIHVMAAPVPPPGRRKVEPRSSFAICRPTCDPRPRPSTSTPFTESPIYGETLLIIPNPAVMPAVKTQPK
jgi:hypothetical protein